MALPLIALGAGLLRKTKAGKKAGKLLGNLGRKVATKVFKNSKSARSAKVSSAPVMLSPATTLATTLPDVQNASILPGEWPQKVGDVLGEITKPSREFTTSVDKNTILYLAAAAAVLILLMKK